MQLGGETPEPESAARRSGDRRASGPASSGPFDAVDWLVHRVGTMSSDAELAAEWWAAPTGERGVDAAWVVAATLGVDPAGLAPLSAAEASRALERVAAVGLRRQRARDRSREDPLMGILRRDAAEALMRDEVARAHRTGWPLTVVSIDGDGLRNVNLSLGEEAGDTLLAHLGEAVRTHVEPHHIAARWGGDEVVLVLPGVSMAPAVARVEAITSTLATVGHGATMSAGLATLDEGEGLEAVLARADRDMYRRRAERGHVSRNHERLADARERGVRLVPPTSVPAPPIEWPSDPHPAWPVTEAMGERVAELPEPLVREVLAAALEIPADALAGLDRAAVVTALGRLTAMARDTRRAEQLATWDGLTEVMRRDAGRVAMQREVADAHRTAEPLVVAVVDGDDLKRVNDSQGHQAGDAMLVGIARALRESTRASDLVVRYTPTEFVVCFPQTAATDAGFRLAQAVALLRRESDVSVSVGTARLASGETLDQLLARARSRLLADRRERGYRGRDA